MTSQGTLSYNLFRKESFENINTWSSEIENNTDENVLIYLVGNRVDLAEIREVSYNEGISCA